MRDFASLTVLAAALLAVSAKDTPKNDGVIEIVALNPGQEKAPCLGSFSEFTCQRGACEGGYFVRGLCAAGEDVQCCFKKSDSRCRAAHGRCKLASRCEAGTSRSGLCYGGVDVTCCVEDRRFTVTKEVSAEGASYEVLSAHDERLAFTADSWNQEMGFKGFKLVNATGETVARATSRWSFSSVWNKKLPVYGAAGGKGGWAGDTTCCLCSSTLLTAHRSPSTVHPPTAHPPPPPPSLPPPPPSTPHAPTDMEVEADASYPTATFLLAESPNGRLSLHGVTDKHSETHRGVAECTLEGSWSKDLRLRSGKRDVAVVRSDGEGKWGVTVRDVSGDGKPTLDPRVALLASMISNYRQP